MSVSCEDCRLSVGVSETDRSLIQRRPTEYGTSECDRGLGD